MEYLFFLHKSCRRSAGEWVITGSQLKKNVEGDEVITWDIADVYIEEGKIGAFWVWTRADAVQDQ